MPWLTQAQDRVKSYGVYPWVSSNANNAETETPARLALARKSGDASLVLLKNATVTRKDGSTGKLLPLSVPTTGNFKVLVLGFYANNANFYLGGYSSIQGAAGQANEVTPYAGIKTAIQAINPSAQVDLHERLHRYRHEREQLLRDDRPDGRVGGGELRLRDRLRGHGLNRVGGDDGNRGP